MTFKLMRENGGHCALLTLNMLKLLQKRVFLTVNPFSWLYGPKFL